MGGEEEEAVAVGEVKWKLSYEKLDHAVEESGLA